MVTTQTPRVTVTSLTVDANAEPEWTVTVLRYGMPADVDLPELAYAQLRLAHELRNALVQAWHEHQDTKAAIWSSYPQVAAVEQQLAAAEQLVADLQESSQSQRAQDRSRALRPDTASRLRDAKAQVRQLRAQRRAAIADARVDAKPRLAAADETERAAAKGLYRDLVQDRGLYWATYNQVLDHHRAAVARVTAARAAGQPATLRYQRWDGSGTLAVQLQRQAHQPARTPALLGSGQGPWRNVFQLGPVPLPKRICPRCGGPVGDPNCPACRDAKQVSSHRRNGHGHGRVLFSLGRGQEPLRLPIQLHRLLPEEADVVGAQLVVRRTAGGRRVHLSVTARVPAVPTAAREAVALRAPVVAVHLGWRRDDDQAVRVATWRSTAPISVPASLADIVTQEGPTTGTISLPAHWRDRLRSLEKVAARRGTDLEDIRAQLVAYLGADGESPVTAAEVARWRAPRRFAQLASDWRGGAHPRTPAGPSIATRLERWRQRDRRRWESHTHGRLKTLGQRDDAYRRVAAWLAGAASRVVLDDTDLRELARREAPTDTPAMPGVVADRASTQRHEAAAGELRAAISRAGKRDGVPVTVVSHQGTTVTHYRCGHANPADGRYAAARTVVCDGCGQRYDQDASATLLMLAASGQVPPAGGVTARSTSEQG